MSISIPINEVSIPPMIDIELFKARVTKYAQELLKHMANADRANSTDPIKHHTSSAIESLCLHSGQTAPTDLDEFEAIFLEKYA